MCAEVTWGGGTHEDWARDMDRSRSLTPIHAKALFHGLPQDSLKMPMLPLAMHFWADPCSDCLVSGFLAHTERPQNHF